MAGDIDQKRYVIHPAKFSLWLFIVSSILLFGGLTSAYIVSKGIETDKEMWHYFEMPSVLYVNTVIMIFSSVIFQVGVWGAKKGDFKRARIGMILALVLGVLFLAGQVMGWMGLRDSGVVFGGGGTNSGNYLYVLMGVHAAHLVAGLVFISIVLFRLMSGRIKTGNVVSIENSAVFWHFLGLLWLYLFIFLLFNQGTPMI